MSGRNRAAFVALMVVVAACGGDSTPTEDTSPKTTKAPTTSVASDEGSTSDETVPEEPTPEADSAETSLESPLAVGAVATVGDWAVRVTSIASDATDVVMDENQFNDPPAAGEAFVLISIEATYVGSESSTFWVDNTLKVIGPSKVAYDAFDAWCGSIPNAIDDKGETFPGGTLEGNECWRVSAEEAESLVLSIESSFTFDGERHFLSLDPTATPIDASTAAGGAGLVADSVIAVGEVADVGDWSIRVTSVTPDGTDIVMAENEFNDPPGGDELFFLVGLEATYIGQDSSDFWIDMTMKVVGDSSVAYDSYAAYCGVIPTDINDTGEAFPGGTITGNECWSVSASDADSLVLIVEESFSSGTTRTIFSLDASAEPLAGSTAFEGSGVDTSGAIPLGETGQVDDWSMTILAVDFDAAALVLAENQFNDPPGDGEVFALVTIEATYTGSESSLFWIENTLKVVGPSSVAYDSFVASCGIIPNAINDAGEAFPDATIVGAECWRITQDDAGSLVLLAEGFLSDERQIFLLSE